MGRRRVGGAAGSSDGAAPDRALGERHEHHRLHEGEAAEGEEGGRKPAGLVTDGVGGEVGVFAEGAEEGVPGVVEGTVAPGEPRASRGEMEVGFLGKREACLHERARHLQFGCRVVAFDPGSQLKSPANVPAACRAQVELGESRAGRQDFIILAAGDGVSRLQGHALVYLG